MKLNKQERLEIINKLIKFISEKGRRFFYCKGQIAYMKLKNNRIYFVDDYTGKEVYAYPSYNDRKGFSHGGTLWGLVNDFREFISKGEFSNGKHGYGGLYSPHWGYPEEDMQAIRQYAKEIGYLK
jgi:hypothetical protein